MPTVNLSVLANQARYIMQVDGNKSEGEAISEALEQGNITEEFAAEHNLKEAISKYMNRDDEQERAEAEAQLDQQAQAGFQTDILTDDEGDTAPKEADLQDAPTEFNE